MEIKNSIEHKLFEQHLQFLSSITEKVLDAIIVTDTDCKIIYVNDTAKSLYGYSKEELTGKTPAILNAEPMSVEIQENIYSTVSKGGVWSGSILNRKKDGSTFTCECKVTPHYDTEGQIIAYICIQRDITKRKQEEERHKAIIQTAVDGFWICNMEGKLLEVNDSYCEMIGYSRKELLEMSISDIEAIESPEDTIRHIQKLKKLGYARFETRHRRKDSKIIDVEISSNYLAIGEGQIFTFVRDITERKEAEKARVESEQKYRDLYDNAPVTYYSVGNDGLIKENNKAAQNWLGYSKKELIGMRVFDIYTEESRPKSKLLFEQLKQGKSIKNEEMVYLRKDKQKVYGLLSVNPIVDLSGRIIASRSVVKDITKLKQAEETLKDSQRQLRNLSARIQHLRDEERRNIARRIHDELGQLLTALKIELSWLQKQVPREREMLIDKMEEILKLVDLSMQVVKGVSTELRPGLLYDVGLTAAVEWQLEQFQKLIGIQYIVKSTPKQIVLDQDLAEAFFGIFQELITNTVRHAEATRASINLRKQDGKLTMIVKDNGKGITEQQIHDPKSLGLVGVKERAYFLGGKVIIAGVPGKGTTVTVTIPLNKEANDEDTHH